VSINSWAGFGPLYVAKERGLFGDLDVEIVRVDDSATRRANLANGSTQILGSTIDDLAVINSISKPAVAIGCADYSNGADGILGGGEITSLSKLADTRVAVDHGFVNHFFLLYVLDKNGISVNALKLAQMKPDDAGIAFASGKVDAAVTWQPHISTALEQRKGSVLLASTKDYPEAIVDLYVTDGEWATANPEILRRFRDGWDRAVQFTRNNPDAAYRIMSDKLKISEADLGAIFQDVGLLTTAECRTTIGSQWASLAGAAVRLWRQAGILKRDVDLRSRLALN
jgi:NitT/TauT family transport system substrate-binding protein